MKKAVVLVFVFLTGCASATYYYPTPDEKPVYPVIDEDKRQEITFSVFSKSLFEPEKDLRKEIKERLLKTGLFKKVRYSFEGEKSPLHFHFMYRDYRDDGFAIVFAPFLGVIPMGIYHTRDYSMTAYWKNKEIYSVIAPATQRVVIWLPLFPLFLSGPISRYNMHNYAFDYIFSKIAEEKLYDPETFMKKEK